MTENQKIAFKSRSISIPQFSHLYKQELLFNTIKF